LFLQQLVHIGVENVDIDVHNENISLSGSLRHLAHLDVPTFLVSFNVAFFPQRKKTQLQEEMKKKHPQLL